MKNISRLFTTMIALAASASAAEWIPMGARSVGMGGTGVADSQGPIADYWNPAALGRATENSYGFQLPFTIHAAITGSAVAGAKDLSNAQNMPNGTVPQATAQKAAIQNALNEFAAPGTGFRVNATSGGNFKIGKIAFFAHGFLDAGATPRPDLVDVSTGNKSNLLIKGARIVEFGAGYGHELFIPGLFVGGDIKLMNAQVGYTFVDVVNNDKNNPFSDLKNGAKTSSNIGLDAGALWDVNRTFEDIPLSPRAGIVYRNINNPKFDLPASAIADGQTGKFSVNPQLRVGASIHPFHWWTISSDLDMTDNLTQVSGLSSRQFGLGTEINVFNRSWINIPLRAGISRNLADTGAGPMVSLGSGVNLLHFMIDASLAASPKRVQIESQNGSGSSSSKKFPTEVTGALQISLLFGGSDTVATTPKAPVDDQPVSTQKIQEVRDNADKAHQELNKEAAKPAGQ